MLALLLISGLLSALPALSQARPLYYGISANSRSANLEKETFGDIQDEAAATGVTRIREDLEWEKIEPSDDEWDWARTDQMYEEAAERDLNILPIPNSPPCWAVWLGTTDCDEYAPGDTDEYAEFVGRVAARYGPGGDFWDAHPGLDKSLASRYIEIWNEPYWKTEKDKFSPGYYALMYKDAVIAGRAANPATRYLIESAMGGSGGEWLAGIYVVEPSIGNYIDGIAVHPYPGSHGISYAPTSITDESFLNAKINYEEWKARGVNRPVWITEVGYSSCSDPEHCVPGSPQAARETQKAAMLKPLLDALGTDEYGFVHAVYLYNLRQTTPASEPNKTKSNWYGITNKTFEHLPAWTTFVEAVEAYDGTPEPNSSITSQSVSGESATFNFSSNDSTSVFSCQLDGGSWTACTSPKTYASTGGGLHTFNVRATNAEAVDASPATYSWITPPGAITESATGVKGTEAVLNGSVNPRGTATSYYFEYGTTTTYGSTMPVSPKAVGSGVSAVKVSESISGLTGNTTYHVRVVAENASGGITKGSDLTFKTAKTMESSLSSLPLIEVFDGSTGSGSGPFMPSSDWYKPLWAASKGQDTVSGWGPYNATPAVDGAYYVPGGSQSYKDSPSGAAAAGTIAAGPALTGQYLSLWLIDATGFASNPKGYELRITQKGSGQYDLTLYKLSVTSTFPPTSIRTTLASASNYSLALGAKVALADTGGSVSAWIDQGAGFKQVLSAADSAYSNGWVGLSGMGTAGRLVNFKGGAL
ncbi:MAG TPA: hypothetical protein VFS54_00470 [Solirubrobacterales bacterium]|nr:hypothetical protein [Solirubrobacterales bacterium]